MRLDVCYQVVAVVKLAAPPSRTDESRGGGLSQQFTGEPLPRCCEQHPDWPTLLQHLAHEFPELTLRDLIHELRRAKQAVDNVGLDAAEALATAELIARHQIMLRLGQTTEVARLDPERHARTD